LRHRSAVSEDSFEQILAEVDKAANGVTDKSRDKEVLLSSTSPPEASVTSQKSPESSYDSCSDVQVIKSEAAPTDAVGSSSSRDGSILSSSYDSCSDAATPENSTKETNSTSAVGIVSTVPQPSPSASVTVTSEKYTKKPAPGRGLPSTQRDLPFLLGKYLVAVAKEGFVMSEPWVAVIFYAPPEKRRVWYAVVHSSAGPGVLLHAAEVPVFSFSQSAQLRSSSALPSKPNRKEKQTRAWDIVLPGLPAQDVQISKGPHLTFSTSLCPALKIPTYPFFCHIACFTLQQAELVKQRVVTMLLELVLYGWAPCAPVPEATILACLLSLHRGCPHGCTEVTPEVTPQSKLFQMKPTYCLCAKP
jgi:hypothetical protein